MVWFLVALVLLVAALILLWLDARRRGGAAGSSSPAVPVTGDNDDDNTSPSHEDEVPGQVGQSGQPAAAGQPGQLSEHERDMAFELPEQSEEVDQTRTLEPGEAVVEPAEPEEQGAVESAEPVEPAGTGGPAGPSKLSDRVRRLLPRRGPDRGRGTVAVPEPEPADPLADSPVVQWLETREFAPTPTPAPDFRHGDFACGLPSLGTVSHGIFRGRRAIMGVAGGRAVLALQRDTASDVVLDLSRPDVDVEPGFHDAGEVAALEARTSDYGRLELVDRERLSAATRSVPADVRRVWAESEWVAATVDGAENPATWDDTVVVLYETADALAPLPPVGGRARPLPAEIDPGAPGAAAGPDADPAGGVPDPAGHRPSPASMGPAGEGSARRTDDHDADTEAATADAGVGSTQRPVAAVDPASTDGAEATTAPVEPRRSGHLRLVPERPAGVRDLADKPVVADRGDAEATDAGGATEAGTDQTTEADQSVEQAEPAEPDPFDQIMEPTGPVASRGDVAADHLETRPPLSRPSRGAGHTYPEDASVPPLASGANAGEVGIKPLGSDDDEDEIRSEVERFDAARTDGGTDFGEYTAGRHEAPESAEPEPGTEESESGGRHGVDDLDPSEVTQRLSVADLAARMGVDPSEMRSSSGRRRRRRAEQDEGDHGEATDDASAATAGSGDSENGRERPGAEPDVERTMRIRLPKGPGDGEN